MSSSNKAKNIRNLFAAVFWLLVWQGASMLIGKAYILPAPLDTARALGVLLTEASFYRAILSSLLRIMLGFVSAVAAGICLAVLAYRFTVAETLVSPLLSAMKAAPVASIVILALFLLPSSRYLSVLISFFMVLPVIYVNLLTGLKSTDVRMLEMAKVFRLKPKNKFIGIYLPAVLPHFLSAMLVAIGICWKSGIAAEVIGQPKNSIGSMLYYTKVNFDVKSMFAWTVMIVLISVLLEKAAVRLIRYIEGRLSK